MVEIADRDRGARSDVIVSVVVEQAYGGRVGMGVKIPSYPVVAIAKAVGKQPVPGVEQQTGGFDGSAGDNHQVGGLPLEPVVGIEIRHAAGLAAVVEKDFACHAAGADLAIAGGQSRGDHRVVAAGAGVD